MVVSEGLLAEPMTEELADSDLNMSSRNNDSDSADQETAKSMLSFLLPQAIPLLKRASSKKPQKNDMSETLSSRLNPSDSGKMSQLDDASGTGIANP